MHFAQDSFLTLPRARTQVFEDMSLAPSPFIQSRDKTQPPCLAVHEELPQEFPPFHLRPRRIFGVNPTADSPRVRLHPRPRRGARQRGKKTKLCP